MLVGDPRLRLRARPVGDPRTDEFRRNCARLHATLVAFRRAHGFGRAIAAPQIGIDQRFVAVDLGEGPFTLVNPEIVARSRETFTLWDDCMCFPDLLIRVRRHASISLRYTDEEGRQREWNDLGRAASELFQHEIDHLDGILALDRVLDHESIVHRKVFEERRAEFEALVDGV